ncbi:MAG: Ig-like domain-containing protein [Nocardioides sp.]
MSDVGCKELLVPTPQSRHSILAVLALLLATLLTSTPAHAAGLAAPSNLSPDATSVDGTPVLSWSKVSGATNYAVEVYRVSDSTKIWSATTVQRHVVPARQLPQGQLMWRVRAMSGATSSNWVEANIDRDALAGPALVGPSPGSLLSQPDEPVVLNWTPINGATQYTTEISTDSSFTDTKQITTTTTKTTSFVVQNVDVAQPYYWRVRATLATDLLTDWSEVGDYEVGGLAKPVLTSPEDGAFTDVEDVVLDWEPVPGARAYNLQVSVDKNFSTGNVEINQANITGTRYSPPTTLNNDQYYWRVQPIDSSGNVVDWSAVDVWTFRRYWPEQPELTYPYDNDVVSDPLYFQWTPVPHASHYEFQISPNITFTGAGTKFCPTTATTYVPSINTDCWIPGGATYYWRVIGFDDPKGVQTDAVSAEVRQVTYLPERPEPITPTGSDTPAIPTLSWTPVARAAQYQVTISAVDGGAGSVSNAKTTATSYTPRAKLSPGKTYRWDVRTVSASGRLGPGLLLQDMPTFTVGDEPTATSESPEPIGPADGTESSRFPTLTWEPVPDATQYRVLVRREGTFSWSTVPDWFFYPAGEDDTTMFLQPGTYEWMVQAYQGSSSLLAYSTGTSTFTISPLDAVTGQHVALSGEAAGDPGLSCDSTLPDQCMDLRQTPVLAWDPSPDAGAYQVWISKDKEMTNILSGYPKLVEGTEYLSTVALPDGQAGSAYYWHIQPCRVGSTTCEPLAHADNAFNKLSKPVETISPADDDEAANDITFEWRDYLETNQDPSAYPSSDETGVSLVDPTVEAKQYRVQVSVDANFQTQLESRFLPVDQTTYTSFENTFPEGPLYWRVQAIDGTGNNLAWSAPVKFFKRSPTTTLLSPVSDEEVPGSFPLSWEPVNYAAGYDVEIYKNGDTTGSPANRVLADSSLVSSASLKDPLPVAATPYTWRVRPKDVKGRPGRWTDLADPSARFYVTGAAPALLDPAEGSNVVADDVLFSWTAAEGATSYQFERRLVGSTASSETIKTPALGWAPYTAIAEGLWQWRVSSLDAKGKVIGAAPWQTFRVDSTRPTVTRKSPTGKVSRTTNFVVKFSEPVAGVTAKRYSIRVAGTTKKLLATVTVNAAGTKATLDPAAPLKAGKKYTIKLTSGIKDLSGNRLVPTQWTVTAK